MKLAKTQPLEQATPVVPETQATIDDDRDPAPRRAAPAADPQSGERPRSGGRDSNAGQDDETYPDAPTGSAGHP